MHDSSTRRIRRKPRASKPKRSWRWFQLSSANANLPQLFMLGVLSVGGTKMFFLFTEKHCLFSIGSVAASTERQRPSGPNTSSPMARSAIVLQPDGVAIGVLSANALPLPFPISRSGYKTVPVSSQRPLCAIWNECWIIQLMRTPSCFSRRSPWRTSEKLPSLAL
jgi:hypothetical protein